MTKKIAAFIKKQLGLRLRYIAFALLAFLALNALWWVAGQWFFTFRPVFNYDYLPAIAVASVSGILGFVLVLFVFAEELFISNALIYHFHDISSFITSGQYAGSLEWGDFFGLSESLFLAGGLMLALVLCWFLRGRTNAIAAFLVLLLAFGADQLNGSSYLIKSDHQMIKGNIAGSSSLKIYVSFKENTQAPKPLSPVPAEEQVMPLDKILSWSHENPDRSILFVVVESYGVNNSKAVDLWLKGQLLTKGVRKAYWSKFGHARFAGATTAAELRHMCAVKGSYNAVFNESDLLNCVPQAFADLGYPVTGAHGFTGNMFRRNVWWPQIGIGALRFAPEFEAMDAPGCGSGLYGTCDDFIIRYLGKRMQEEPGFYYHLTLNTHLPVVDIEPPSGLSKICGEESMPRQVCTLNAKVGEYLRALAAVLETIPEDKKPFVFVVGDHAPPFSAKTSRAFFSKKETPYFILTPRS